VSGCKDRITTGPDLGFLRVDPLTVEALIPFEDFGDDVQVFGGYGSASTVGRGFVALYYDGLSASTLFHLSDYPQSADVPGTLTFSDGRLVLFFDTLLGSVDSPVAFEVFRLHEQWHAPTVTWEAVVDTAGERTEWSQPGGGLPTLLAGGTFDVSLGQRTDDEAGLTDSVSIALDSATVVILGDSTSGTTGLLVAGAEPGTFLHLVDVQFRITTTASNVPDTVFEVSAQLDDLTYMFDPTPTAPLGWLRVGGTPASRSVITMSIPRIITGTPEACGAVGCEIDLTEVKLNLAELVLTTRQTESAFQPQDAQRVDIRPVLNPELLPKSPLGAALLPVPRSLAPELFSTQAGTQVSLSVTNLVNQLLLVAAAEDTVPAQASIVVFSIIEPITIGFVSFEGAAGVGAPALRLLYTIANDVRLP
jgi:hypothetical protein